MTPLQAYARQVDEVRALQRRFFAGDRSVWRKAQKLELALDAVTARILAGQAVEVPGSLFGEGADDARA